MNGMDLDQLAPGVQGYTMEHHGATYIPLIVAETPGNGDVGRYLDSLPPDRTWKVPNVVSERLDGMLRRRGFEIRVEIAEGPPANGEHVLVWTRGEVRP